MYVFILLCNALCCFLKLCIAVYSFILLYMSTTTKCDRDPGIFDYLIKFNKTLTSDVPEKELQAFLANFK